MLKTLFNDNWKFWEEKDSFALVWSVPEDAMDVTLPHDAMLIKEKSENSLNGKNTGYRDGGTYTYLKNFRVEKEDIDKTFMLLFEGVYEKSTVYINGQAAKQCIYGYTAFCVELNDYLNFGEDNEIRVSVHNAGMPNSRWYSGSGIYRDVYLLKSSGTFIEYGSNFVNTSYADNDYALLNLNASIKNRLPQRKNLILQSQIFDMEGKLVYVGKRPLCLFAGEKEVCSYKITIDNPKLWSDEDPYLYTIKHSITDKEEVVDVDECRFGIRVLGLDRKKGLSVNSKSVKLRGACIHHDNGLLGAASLYEAEYRKIEKMKKAGFNAIRSAHNPASPALLRACDELGVYVMDEAFDMWSRCKNENDYAINFESSWRFDVEAMVKKDRPHPSVIMYSVGNEIPEIGNDKGAKLCKEISDYIKSLDDKRFTLASINGVFAAGDCIGKIMADIHTQGDTSGNVNDFMTLLDKHMGEVVNHKEISDRLDKACAFTDIAGYNYMAPRYENDLKNYPDRIIVGSETYPPAIAKEWKLISNLPNVIGDFTWTGWDYIGEAGVGVTGYKPGEGGFASSYPIQLAYVGDFDITGFRRPASYFREIAYGFRKNPYIVTQNPYRYGQKAFATPWIISDSIESWTYPDMEGKPIVVEVYSAGDEAELFVNDKSLGREKVKDCIARFDCIYNPGTLKVISYENGKIIGESLLKTAKESSLKANLSYTKGNLSYIDIINADEEGVLDTFSHVKIKLTVEGAIEYRVGSANYAPDYNYIGDETDLFLGRGQLIIRKKDEKDKAVIKIKSDNEEITITI